MFIFEKYSLGCKIRSGAKFASDEAILGFAQQAFDDFSAGLGESQWLDQLVLVDIMWNDSEGRMVVNDIEMIEADYKFNEALDSAVFGSLVNYLRKEINKRVVHTAAFQEWCRVLLPIMMIRQAAAPATIIEEAERRTIILVVTSRVLHRTMHHDTW